MNVYEESHKLAKAIKESEEYKELKSISEKIQGNQDLKNMIKDFMEKQVKVQTNQMLGNTVDENLLGEIQKLSAIVMKDPIAADYLQAQMRFGIMMQDVYRIIGETGSVAQL